MDDLVAPKRRRSVKMLDVARAAGLSRAAVSLAFKGSPLLRDETREQVLAAAKSLGYVYNRNAANLRKISSDTVGMIINDLTNPFFAELAVGCERVLQRANHIVVLANTAESSERQDEVLRRMREQNVAGIIICPARGTPPNAFAELHAAGIPVVQAMRYVDAERASMVLPDNRAGAEMAVSHLAGIGHRRIAFLGGFDDTSVLRDRRGGYLDGLRLANLPVDPTLILSGAPTRELGASAVPQLLASASPPTALLAFNDAVALGFCTGLRRAGRQPGQDFAVIGFDDVSEAAYSVPALSTIAVDPQGLGEKAAEMLLQQIKERPERPNAYIGSVRLIRRDT